MMHQYSTSKSHDFYGDPSESLVIDANPLRNQDIYSQYTRAQAVAISVGLDANGTARAMPLQRGLTGANSHRGTSVQNALNVVSRPLAQFLDECGDRSVMIDVAGTSPRLVDTVMALLKNQGCIDRVCCGSRFDAVGETLARRLPHALHFMPRATRARLTLNLMLNSALPDVRPFSVINLPMMFEGIKMVTPTLIERMNQIGIRVNVISSNDVGEQIRLTRMAVDAVIVNLTPRAAVSPKAPYTMARRFTVAHGTAQRCT